MKQIFHKLIEPSNPSDLIRSVVEKYNDNILRIRDFQTTVNQNCFVIGFGEDTYQMAIELEKILGPDFREGIISRPIGGSLAVNDEIEFDSKIMIFEGGGDDKLETERMKILIEERTEDDILFVLISGSGSDLLCWAIQKYARIRLLTSMCEEITTISPIWKTFSEMKRETLPALEYFGTTVALVDVGEPSHLFIYEPSDNKKVMSRISEKFGSVHQIPRDTRKISEKTTSHDDESSFCLYNFSHFTIKNETVALAVAKYRAESMGYVPIVISSHITGLLTDIAAMYSQLMVCICLYLQSRLDSSKRDFVGNMNHLASSYYDSVGNVNSFVEEVAHYAGTIRTYGCAGRKLFLINGGKPLVKAMGEGSSGRNKQLALDVAVRLCNFRQVKGGFMSRYHVAFASIDINEVDKSTNNAGALSYISLAKDAQVSSDIDAISFLQNNNTHSFSPRANHIENEDVDVHFLMIGTK